MIRLHVDAPEPAFEDLQVSDRAAELGEQVIVVGSPMGLEQTISDGIVSAVRELPEHIRAYQITAPVSPGSSGSPVINMRGQVIGVASRQLLVGQNLNFAVCGERILAMKLGKEVSIAKWVEVNLPEVLYAKALKEMGLEGIEDLDAIDYIELLFKVAECNQDKAIIMLEEVIKRKQNHFSALLLAGIIESRLGYDNNNYEPILESEFKHCKKITAREIPSEFLRVRAKKLLAHDIMAIGYLKDSIKAKPHSMHGNITLAKIYRRNGLEIESIDICEKLISLYPKEIGLYRLASSIYETLENRVKQVELLKVAIAINPADALPRSDLAMAYAEMNKMVEAKKECDGVSNIDPDKGESCHDYLLSVRRFIEVEEK